MTADKWRLRLALLESGYVNQQRSFSGQDVIMALIVRSHSISMRTVIRPTDNIKDKLDELWEDLFVAILTKMIGQAGIRFIKKSHGDETKTLAQ